MNAWLNRLLSMESMALSFILLLAVQLNPFPLDRDTYGLQPPGGGGDLQRLVYLIYLGIFTYTLARLFVATAQGKAVSFWRDLWEAWPLLLLLLWGTISIFFSQAPERSSAMLTQQATYLFLTIALTSSMTEPDRFLKMLRLACLVCVTISIIGVLVVPERAIHQVSGTTLAYDLQDLWRGVFVHKNFGAGFLAFGAVICFCRIIQARGNFIDFALLVMTAVFIFFSGSVSAVISPMAAILFAWALSWPMRSKTFTVAATICLVAIVAIFPYFVTSYLAPEYGITLENRSAIWTAHQAIIGNRVLTGYGYQAVSVSGSPLSGYDNLGWISAEGLHAHNGFMDMLGQLGLVGATLVLAFLALGFLGVVKAYRLSGGAKSDRQDAFILSALFLTAVLRSLVEPDFFSNRVHWFVFVVVCLTANRWVRSRLEKPINRVSDVPVTPWPRSSTRAIR